MNNSVKATATGVIAIIIWGFTLPLVRHLQDQLGQLYVPGIMGLILFSVGIIKNRNQLYSIIPCFKVRQFYYRWLSFAGHEILGLVALGIVQQDKIPFLFLIHYLWPTTTILFSVKFSMVNVKNMPMFFIGCFMVIMALFFEIIGDDFSLFQNLLWTDYVAFCFSFIGAISWGLYSTLTKQYQESTGFGIPLPIFQLSLAILIPASLLSGEEICFTLMPHLLLIVFIAFCYVAFKAWDHGVREGNIIILSLFADFIPWIALFFASTLLGIPIETKTIFSAITLVTGAIVTRFSTDILVK